MKIADIKEGLEKAVDAIEGLGPLASALGGETVAKYVAAAQGIADVAQNALDRIGDIAEGVTSQDEAELVALLTRLRLLNDAEDVQALS